MCLIIVTKNPTAFTREHLEDFFQYNSDGLGVMYYDGPKLLTAKWMPEDGPLHGGRKARHTWEYQALDSMIAFWNRYAEAAEKAGSVFAAHFRMRTHGDINHENCHPYPVAEGVQLMHNGILKHGNAADKAKSDTWHYAEKLRPLVEEYGTGILRNPATQEIISSDITGANRFVLGAPGWDEFLILNKETGVEFNGAWLSNTYAWSADLWMPHSGRRYDPYSKRSYQALAPYKDAALVGGNTWEYPGWSTPEESNEEAEIGTVWFLASEYEANPGLFWQDLKDLNPTGDELCDYLTIGEPLATQAAKLYSEELAELVWAEGGPVRWEQEEETLD